uniref:Ribonuclease A-domain domain-containing protein n=1 Tax=Seriola lalandi dorsalis TaxID=1841481 RepID=A0A3B4X123_SERLL
MQICDVKFLFCGFVLFCRIVEPKQRSAVSCYMWTMQMHWAPAATRGPLNCNFSLNTFGKGLCGRTQVQTFIDAGVGAVQQICGWSGRRLQGHSGNLCISTSCMRLYDVRSSHNCRCIRVRKYQKQVIVACDKVYNQCLPVHFERNSGQRPSNRPCA